MTKCSTILQRRRKHSLSSIVTTPRTSHTTFLSVFAFLCKHSHTLASSPISISLGFFFLSPQNSSLQLPFICALFLHANHCVVLGVSSQCIDFACWRFFLCSAHIAVFGARSVGGCRRGRGRRRRRRDRRRGGSRGRKPPGTLARRYLTARSCRRLLLRLHRFFALLMRSRRLILESLISVSLFRSALSQLFVFLAMPKLPSVHVHRNASCGVVAFFFSVVLICCVGYNWKCSDVSCSILSVHVCALAWTKLFACVVSVAPFRSDIGSVWNSFFEIVKIAYDFLKFFLAVGH